MVKIKKPKVKKTEPTEADRTDFAAWQDKKERDREPSDIEDERNQMAKHYGQQSEAIDFSKKTILGQAARPMAAKMLKKRKAELQREPALANKGGAVARELKTFSKDTYRHREDSSTNLKYRMVEILLEKKKVNPWAVCHASTGPEKSEKFERCVMDVKKKHGVKEQSSTILKDRMVQILFEMKRPGHLQISPDKVRSSAYMQGLPQINKYRVQAGKKPSERSPIANDPKLAQKSKALASVFNQQPLAPGEQAKISADKAKAAAERPGVEAGLAKFDRDPVVARIRRQNRRRY